MNKRRSHNTHTHTDSHQQKIRTGDERGASTHTRMRIYVPRTGTISFVEFLNYKHTLGLRMAFRFFSVAWFCCCCVWEKLNFTCHRCHRVLNATTMHKTSPTTEAATQPAITARMCECILWWRDVSEWCEPGCGLCRHENESNKVEYGYSRIWLLYVTVYVCVNEHFIFQDEVWGEQKKNIAEFIYESSTKW